MVGNLCGVSMKIALILSRLTAGTGCARWMLVALLSWAGAPAWATVCRFNTAPVVVTVVSMTVNMGGLVNVPRDYLGSDFFYMAETPTLVPATGSWTALCPDGNTQRTVAISSGYGPVPGMPGVYGTGVPGIGVKVLLEGMMVGDSSPTYGFVALYGPYYGLKYQFVLTTPGPISGGVIDGSKLPVVQFWYGDLLVATGNATGTLNLLPLTCYASNVSVNLGVHQLNEFAGQNKPVTTAPVPFDVSVNGCAGGLNSVSVSLMPNTTSMGNGVVSLSSDSNAQGVGVQILDDQGNPAVFSSAPQYYYAYVSGPNSWSGKRRFAARYYQTGAAVKPGTANAVLTFTMYYQ